MYVIVLKNGKPISVSELSRDGNGVSFYLTHKDLEKYMPDMGIKSSDGIVTVFIPWHRIDMIIRTAGTKV